MNETISSEGISLCQIIRSDGLPQTTTFYTPDESTLQVGHIVHAKGWTIPRHVHVPIERRLTAAAEVLLVRRGRCEIDVFDTERRLVATRELVEGDVVVLFCGGHGFRMLDDTILLEVKQGPYVGPQGREAF